MNSSLLGNLVSQAALPAFIPERCNPDMRYVGLACSCGSTRFRVSGWPRIVSGRGGFFWRTVSRVWREARLPMQDGEPIESPYWLPVFLRCDACGREEVILDADAVVDRIPEELRGDPREAYRCRVCRRGVVDLVVGEVSDSQSAVRADHEMIARCSSCRRQARIAWSEGRPSEQEMRLDVLYGRR